MSAEEIEAREYLEGKPTVKKVRGWEARDDRMYALWIAHEESDLFGYRFDHRDGTLVHHSVCEAYSEREQKEMDDAEEEFFEVLVFDGGGGTF